MIQDRLKALLPWQPVEPWRGESRLTHIVLVGGVAGQVAQEAGERAQLQVSVGAHEIHQHGQHALLLQRHPAQHRRPLGRNMRIHRGWIRLRLLEEPTTPKPTPRTLKQHAI